MRCQINWMFMKPIFDSEDIGKQLPSETKKFQNVNTLWNIIMNSVK